MLHKAAFLDRDGTIAKDVHYCRDPKDFEILPGVPAAIRLLNQHGYKVVVITNQSGLARGFFTRETLSLIHQKMNSELEKHGAFIDAIYVCPHHPDEGCECRKPKPALILMAATDIGIALQQSYMVGDDPKDVEAGRAAGCRTIRLTNDSGNKWGTAAQQADHVAADLSQAVEWLLSDATKREVSTDSARKEGHVS